MSDSNEDKTYRKLKQIPLEDMSKLLESHRSNLPSPVYHVAGHMIHRTAPYLDITFHYERIKLLEENGWEFEEYVLTLEKQNILAQIAEYNQYIQYPTELIDRAKRFFPNAVFTQAKIELE